VLCPPVWGEHDGAKSPPASQTRAMTEPREDDDQPNNLHPGQHDEGGHGGMATRELDARHGDDAPEDDALRKDGAR
jgi:hypothetical protein